MTGTPSRWSLKWDGNNLTGLVKPGDPSGRMYRNFPGFPIENASFDPKTGMAQLEATYQPERRRYLIQGKVSHNSFIGTWTHPDENNPIAVATRYMDRPEAGADPTPARAPAEPTRTIVRPRPNEGGAYVLAITALGAVGQAVALISTGASARIHVERGASLLVLLKILAKQIFLAVFLGRRVLSSLMTLASCRGIVIAAIAVFAGICIEGYAFCTGPLRLKLFLAFSLCILVVSLVYPMTQPPQWPVLSNAGGIRLGFSLCWQ